MREFSRSQRVAEQMQKEIALLLQREIKDPRLKLTTVSDVEVSKDFSIARVFVTFLDATDQKDIDGRITLLSKAAGLFRSQLGKSMRIRTIPEIKFFYDESIKRGSEMDSLIESALAKDRQGKESEE